MSTQPVQFALLVPLVIFTLVAIIVCIVQIFLRKKMEFLTLCKVSVYLPLLAVILSILKGAILALRDIAKANDLSIPIILEGISNLLSSVYLGIVLTIILAILYAITKAIYNSQNLK